MERNQLKEQRTLPHRTIHGLWYLLDGYKTPFLSAIVCLGAAIAAETGGMLLVRHFVDQVIVQRGAAGMLVRIAAGFLALAALRGGFSFISGRSLAYASEKTIQSLRDRLFDHIQRLSFSYHDKMKTGELIQRVTSDVDTIRRFYAEQVRGFARISFLFIINFVTIAVLNLNLALMSIVSIPLLIWVSLIFYKRIHDTYEAYQEQDGILSAVLQENLTGVRIVRAFARQSFEEEKFEEANSEKLKRGYRFHFAEASFWPICEIIGGLQLAGGILAGGIMVLNGTLTIGTFVAYVALVNGIIWPLAQLGRLIAQVSTTSVSYSRLRNVLGEEQEDTDTGKHVGEKKLSGSIRFRNVHFSYDEKTPVLQNINLECAPGQRIALVGEPGSGKSSLVNLLPRFYTHTSGNIEIDGKSIDKYSRRFLRENIGIVEQEPFLFSTDIRSNITYGVRREPTQAEIERAAAAAAIHESIASFPDGYDTVVGERGVTLSGGQKQRIAIARILLKDPAILILDDSTSSVDSETEELINSALDDLMRGRTTFIVAHRVQSLMSADRIIVFKDGNIVENGIHDELIKQRGFYRNIFELQTSIETELEEHLSNA